MLFGANLAKLIVEAVTINTYKTDNSAKKAEIYEGFNSTAYLLFNVAHWMFASKYFTMARQTPYKVAKQEVPREIVRCDNITNWVFLSFNAISPLLYGVGFIVYYAASSAGNEELANIFY